MDDLTRTQELERRERERRERRRLQFGGPLLARRAGEREALLITLVCTLDMYTTLWWVSSGLAIEANPLLAWAFDLHPLAFVLIKSALFLPAMILAPALARRHPRFTVRLLRLVLVAYVGIYVHGIR